MFELCDFLVGIYKTENITKSLTVEPRTISEKRGHLPNDILPNNDVLPNNDSINVDDVTENEQE